jgi:hypothetical protein
MKIMANEVRLLKSILDEKGDTFPAKVTVLCGKTLVKGREDGGKQYC